MDINKFQITEFQPDKMIPDPAIVMIARRGSGKSWVCRDILYHLKHIPGGIVLAPTDRHSPFYKWFFPDLFIHYEIKEELFVKVLSRQALMLEKSKEKKKKGLFVDPSGIFVMDDCLADSKTWKKDKNIREILMNGRHYKLTYILTMQTPLGIDPDLRLNFDYVFLLKEDSTINRKKLWDNYASMIPNLQSFNTIFSKCTSDYCCMVIDNRKATDTIQEKVFWFKAKEYKFSFGSKNFKEIHKKYYDPEFLTKKARAVLMDGNRLLNKKKKNEIDIKVEKI